MYKAKVATKVRLRVFLSVSLTLRTKKHSRLCLRLVSRAQCRGTSLNPHLPCSVQQTAEDPRIFEASLMHASNKSADSCLYDQCNTRTIRTLSAECLLHDVLAGSPPLNGHFKRRRRSTNNTSVRDVDHFFLSLDIPDHATRAHFDSPTIFPRPSRRGPLVSLNALIRRHHARPNQKMCERSAFEY